MTKKNIFLSLIYLYILSWKIKEEDKKENIQKWKDKKAKERRMERAKKPRQRYLDTIPSDVPF